MKFLERRMVSIIVALLLAVTLGACSVSQGEAQSTESAETTQTPVAVTEAATPTATTEATPDATETPESAVPNSTEAPESVEPIVTPTLAVTAEPTNTAATQVPAPTDTPAKETTTQKPAVQVTRPAAQTTAPSVQTPKPTIKPTPKPTTVPNDKVATEINLDSKVPAELRPLYDMMKEALTTESVKANMKKEIRFSHPLTDALYIEVTQDQLFEAVSYLSSYNPQLFYVDMSYYEYAMQGDNVVSVTFDCTSTVNQYDAVEKKVSQIVAEANKKGSLFERELYIHDWLVKNVKYDKNTKNCGNIYGALIEGKAKCEGYAKAFQYLMNKIGVETVLITGYAGEAHMWNMVKLYGEYYFVDVTHDDPLPDENIPDGKDYLIDHSCFNVTTKTLEKTHTIDAKGSYSKDGFLANADLQTCTAKEYGYYQVKGLAVSNLSEMQSILYANRSLQNVEVFFTGTMPKIEDIVEAFNAFMDVTYPGKGYAYSYTDPSTSAYKRNVVRLTWKF